MAQIVINEISQNYTYNIGSHSYATVALPITACWGPGYEDPATYSMSDQDMLEKTTWQRFPATQEGQEAFVRTYRGPMTNYRMMQDYSYYMAMSLLTAGYDVLVCRVAPGVHARGTLTSTSPAATMQLTAKYAGTFGNNLLLNVTRNTYFVIENKVRVEKHYYSIVTYLVDEITGTRSAMENISFVLDPEDSTDSVLYYEEVESKYWDMILDTEETDGLDDCEFFAVSGERYIQLAGGLDYGDNVMNSILADNDDEASQVDGLMDAAIELATRRYEASGVVASGAFAGGTKYGAILAAPGIRTNMGVEKAKAIYLREWVYTKLVCADITNNDGVFDLLKDKLAYNPNRIISGGWDDQDLRFIYGDRPSSPIDYTVYYTDVISPIHKKMMEVAYYSRCATAYVDIPRSCPRSRVYTTWDEEVGKSEADIGYAQKLARLDVNLSTYDVNGVLFHTHTALFAPWCQFRYTGTGKMNIAAPSFLALMIQRAQILNQAVQYEWALPTNRKHNLRIGKLDYTVRKKQLDVWQKLEGVGVNVITTIPDLGTNIWGNSTLFEVPPATYQALANLSTRLLVNAVEDVVYRCGISITWQYNNDQAYNKFYAGVTPILDTMKNVGAIDDYYVKMAADINGLDQVNANTVIGKVYLVINGVINDIVVDLIALPPGTDLNQYRQ